MNWFEYLDSYPPRFLWCLSGTMVFLMLVMLR